MFFRIEYFKSQSFFVLGCFLLLVFISCKDITDSSLKTNSIIEELDNGAYAKSAGRSLSLTVVMDNFSWQHKIGEAFREVLAAPVKGLPQPEPLFTIRQMNQNAFTGFVRKSRCFLKVVEGAPKGFKVLKNEYARPQIGIVISGQTPEEIISCFQQNKEQIVTFFKQMELYAKQQRIKRILPLESIKEDLQLTIKIPRSYRLAKKTSDFYWFRKNIPHGGMNILVYAVPQDFFVNSKSMPQNIIRLRDSISGHHIPVDKGGRFITEEAFSPYIKPVTLKGFSSIETKGTWEVKNKYMAGPFINYIVKDTASKRLVVLEGFVFAPSVKKRDYILELEAILKTFTLSP